MFGLVIGQYRDIHESYLNHMRKGGSRKQAHFLETKGRGFLFFS